MNVLDDEIVVKHTIKCECLEVFKSMDSWLSHKRNKKHKKRSHVMYAAINNQIELMRVVMEDKKND